MARYNSALASTTITGTHTISSPSQGAFTNLTGTAPYTVTLPNPSLFPGSNQVFYNATGGTVTLSTPSGILTGTGGSNASTVPCFAGNVLSVTSDGTNYVVISEDGSALVATTGSFTGDVTMNGSSATVALTPTTVTIAPVNTSNINNMNIGTSTRGSGAFTSLAANAAVSFTANTASSTTGTGTLVVTGGVGVSGQITATTLSATNIYGTVQTAAQANITSLGTLTGLSISGTSTTTGIARIGTTVAQGDPSTTDITATATLLLSGAGGNFLAFGQKASNLAQWIQSSYSNPTTAVYPISLNPLGGNVGVGTLTPSYPLSIVNASPVLSIGNSSLQGGAVYFGNSAHGVQRPGVTNDVSLYTTSGSIYLSSTGAATTNQFALLNNGNVGIGTSTPQYKLDVNNNANSSGFQASFGSTYSSGLWSGIHFGYSESVNTVYRKSAIVFERTDLTSNNAQGKVHILNGPQSGSGSATIADAKLSIIENGNVGIGRTDPSYKLDISGSLRSAHSFRNYVKSHSSTNSNSGGYQTSTNITQIGDQMYEYSFYVSGSTGGYPTCPYSYWVVCPVQKQDTGSLAWAEVTIRGTHRGMWGTSYDDYASIVVGSGSDGGGIWVKEWKNGGANDGSNRIRVGWMDFNGTYNEGNNYNSGYNLASFTGNTIGNSYYKMPLFLKIYTNCGADKEYIVSVRTTNPDVLGPPYKGALVLNFNVNPTSAMYW